MPKPAITTIHVLETALSHEAGVHETDIFMVPEVGDNLELTVTSHDWPVTGLPVIHCQVWVSYVGGRKWHLLIGFLAHGGAPAPCRVRRHLKPQYKTNQRMVKVRIDCKIPLTIDTQLEFW